MASLIFQVGTGMRNASAIQVLPWYELQVVVVEQKYHLKTQYFYELMGNESMN